jgi:hypothetical protein
VDTTRWDIDYGNAQYRHIVDLCHKITSADLTIPYGRFVTISGHDLINNSAPRKADLIHNSGHFFHTSAPIISTTQPIRSTTRAVLSTTRLDLLHGSSTHLNGSLEGSRLLLASRRKPWFPQFEKCLGT